MEYQDFAVNWRTLFSNLSRTRPIQPHEGFASEAEADIRHSLFGG
jgi:hypothetical protein